MRKKYNEPEFELFAFSFENVLEEGAGLNTSTGEVGSRIGDNDGPEE